MLHGYQLHNHHSIDFVQPSLTFQSRITLAKRLPHVVFFLMGDSPESEFYVPTFRNTRFVPSS